MKYTPEHSTDLIAAICREVRGVGPSKGYALAEYLDNDWNQFLNADDTKIFGLKKNTGKELFTAEQVAELVKNKKEFSDIKDVRSAWIYFIGKNFLISQIQALQSITVSNLDINPFLMKVLNFKTPKEILEFNLYQSVTRSIVTSWGSAVEELLVRCGAEQFVEKNKGARAGRRPDIEKMLGSKKFYIQVKSGPNTMNVDMVNSLNEVIREYKRREPDAKFLLGMTYGTKGRISSQIRDNLNNFENTALIGRELWDFVSEEKNFHHEIFKILDISSRQITTKTFSDHLNYQLSALIDEWTRFYGKKSVDVAYEHFI